MKVTLATFQGKNDTNYIALIINNWSVLPRAIQSIVGYSINKLALNTHALYSSEEIIGVNTNTAKDIFNRIHQRVSKGKDTVMNYNGGSCDLELYPWKELSREELELPYETDLRLLLIEKNKEINVELNSDM